MKLQKEINTLGEFKSDFADFLTDFDLEMDFLANKASYEDGYKQQYQELLQEKINRRSDNDIFSRSEFKMPSFCQIGEKDMSVIDQIGKVVDNSDFSMPLVVFNTQQLQAFSYQEHLREFSVVDLIDEDNLAALEIPRYFKSVYVPDDKFMLIGGLERHTSASSARCFSIDERAKINRLQDMDIGRQYFTICLDEAKNNFANKTYIYVISGFNHEYQILTEVERYCMETRSWESIEPNNTARLNASACKCGQKYIYLFGGLNVEKNEFTDSIERYNNQLQIWTTLTVKFPVKISNSFAFSFNPNFILIMGGITKKNEV